MSVENKTISWDSKEFMVSISRDLRDFILGEYTVRRVNDELAHDMEHFSDPATINRIYNQFTSEILNHCREAAGVVQEFSSPETAGQGRKNQLNYAIRKTLAELKNQYQSLFSRHPDSMLYDLISDAPACFNNLPGAVARSNTLAAFVKNNFTGAEIFGWLDPELQRAFFLDSWDSDHTAVLSERYSLELYHRPDLSMNAIPGSYAYKVALRQALTECCERLYAKHRVSLEKSPHLTVTALLAQEKQLRTI